MSNKPKYKRKANKGLITYSPSFYDLLPTDIKSENFVIKFDTSRPSNRFLIIHRSVKKFYKDLEFHEKLDLYNTCLNFCHHFNLSDTVLSIPIGQWNIATIWKYATAHFTAMLYVPDRQTFVNVFYKLCKFIPDWPSQRYVTPFWLPGSYNTCDTEQYIRSAMTTAPNKKSRYENALAKLSGNVPIEELSSATNRQPFTIKLVTSPNCPALRGFKYLAKESNFTSSSLVRLSDAIYDYAVENLNLKRRGCSICLSLSGPFELGRHTATQGFLKMAEFFNRFEQQLGDISERSSEKSDSENEHLPILDPSYKEDNS